MRRHSWICLLAAVALLSFACSQDGDSGLTASPTAVQSSDPIAVTGAAQPQANICHWSPDYLEEGELYEYHVIGISTNGNAYNAHAAHGDPIGCDVSSAAVGDDCSSCAPPAAGPTAVAPTGGGIPQGKSAICHFDIDDEDPYLSIVIQVSNNAVDKHIANHGDCIAVDPVGTENCTCGV
jgi:hypothetical protein